MPNYGFRCPDCGRRDEEIRKMDDAARPKVCHTCGSNMEREMSAVPARVKGGTKLHHGMPWK